MESERLPPKFAPILEADLAGYDRLTGEDDGVIMMLQRCSARVVTAARSSVLAARTPDVR